jgi:DNA-binding transcriptional regulator PaaX
MVVMSSRRAASGVGKDLLYHALHLIATGKLGDLPPSKLWYLKRRGYLGRDDKKKYYLLPKARRALTEGKVWALTLPVPKHWDRKWHLVLFDIPADKRKRRDIFRLRLKELGLVLYQDSVWIHPYPTEETVRQIAEFYRLSNCVSFIVADKVTGEKSLRQQFKLT